MYIEASNPRGRGDMARIEKSGFALNGNQCLRFYYHMYGFSMGTLKVFVGKTEVFAKSGNHGNHWNLADVNITAISDTVSKSCRRKGKLKPELQSYLTLNLAPLPFPSHLDPTIYYLFILYKVSYSPLSSPGSRGDTVVITRTSHHCDLGSILSSYVG